MPKDEKSSEKYLIHSTKLYMIKIGVFGPEQYL